MKRASIVIGANYGDEGKGLVTDYLAAKHEGGSVPLVVRHNGGAQAGHTVQLADGRRHVFSHFGSGLAAGAETFLSEFFVCNPTIFRREWDELEAQGFAPGEVHLDWSSPMTTIYDMILNQIVEEARGSERHGSVGVGFNETIERCKLMTFGTDAFRLNCPSLLREMADSIRRSWMPLRLAALGFPNLYSEYKSLIMAPELLDQWMDDALFMQQRVNLCAADILRQDRPLIFEGAQGLLLDQDRTEFFPHLTRSNTGIRNALDLCKTALVNEVTVHYVTRAYLTRHGAGPMPNESDGTPYPAIIDPTNKPNAFQGSLRFGLLDLDLLGDAVQRDLRDRWRAPMVRVKPELVMTCLDQVPPAVSFYQDGVRHVASQGMLVLKAAQATGCGHLMASYGPTRHDVKADRIAAPA